MHLESRLPIFHGNNLFLLKILLNSDRIKFFGELFLNVRGFDCM